MTALASTGLEGLDKILCDLKKGDNVVWQVDSVEDYGRFVQPYVNKAIEDGRKVVYIRFARHEPLVEDKTNITVHELDAGTRFESFSTQVHAIISQEGRETYYVFDCLSDLLGSWATDLMVGNFFKVTCPCLFDLDTIAYFGIQRNYHSYQTIARVRETAQLLLDVYNLDDKTYVHPLKVWSRYSPTMFLQHLRQGDKFTPVTNSVDASTLLSKISQKEQIDSARTLDYWDRLFLNSEEPHDSEETKDIVRTICNLLVGRDKKIADLAHGVLSIDDLKSIKNRLVGSGSIGDKAAGMLLARKILSKDKDCSGHLEPHDSFYIGSDVFNSYIIENGWWRLLMRQKSEESSCEAATEIKENILRGKFSTQIRERFQEIVDYFGQSPIIIRSSGLTEAAAGNASVGKYESIFLVNQGEPQQRYAEFENAIRRMYASTMDEQVPLLIQRVSGSQQKGYFFPEIAGVGLSQNRSGSKSEPDPKAGMLRLVFGLGTQATEMIENDNVLTITLDQPLSKSSANKVDAKGLSQLNVDLLDTSQNRFRTVTAGSLLNELGMKDHTSGAITFKKLLSKTDFAVVMQKMLKALEDRFQNLVEIEFTVNFTSENEFKINLVRCRPLKA